MSKMSCGHEENYKDMLLHCFECEVIAKDQKIKELEHQLHNENSTINPHDVGGCPVCHAEYKRGFDEGHENGILSEEGQTVKELEAENKRLIDENNHMFYKLNPDDQESLNVMDNLYDQLRSLETEMERLKDTTFAMSGWGYKDIEKLRQENERLKTKDLSRKPKP